MSMPRAVAASIVAVVAMATAIAIAVSRGGTTRTPAGSGTTPPTTTGSNSAPPADLATLTQNIPCPDQKTDRVPPEELTDFPAVAVFTCGIDDRRYPDGDWTIETREAATPDIAALINAIQAPVPPKPTGDYACADVLYGEPGLVFVDANGNYLLPKFRRDWCDVPLGLDATGTIKWQELSVRKVQLQQSSEEIAAGCSHRYKNMNYFEATLGGSRRDSAGGPVFSDDGALLHACLYSTPDDDVEVGTFVTDKKFNAAESDRLRAALDGSAPTGECAAQHGFALVFDGKLQVDVELGGCWRVLRQDGVGSGDPAELQELLGQP